MVFQVPPEEEHAARDRPAVDPAYGTIASRLWQRYGGGAEPDVRRRLYERLQDEAIAHGPPVYRTIRACVAASSTAREPDRYFAAAVTRRLREQGFLEEPQEEF